jgi:hypothetical protein
MPARYLQLALLLAVAAVGAAFFPSPQRAAPRWTVIVQDERGHGIAGLPLFESWTGGLFGSGKGTDVIPTDASGSVIFPARTSWRCALTGVFTAVRTMTSFGLDADRPPRISMGSPSVGSGLVLESHDPPPAEARARVVRKGDGSFIETPW